jgi:hypothetical protein
MGRFPAYVSGFRPVGMAVMVLVRGFVPLACLLAFRPRFQDVFGFRLLDLCLFLRGRAARGTGAEQAGASGDRQRPGDGGANRRHR